MHLRFWRMLANREKRAAKVLHSRAVQLQFPQGNAPNRGNRYDINVVVAPSEMILPTHFARMEVLGYRSFNYAASGGPVDSRCQLAKMAVLGRLYGGVAP